MMGGVVVAARLLIHRRLLIQVHVLVEGGGDGVHHERSDGSHHRDETREGELGPRVRTQARGCQDPERIWEYVDEAGGQDHAAGKRLDHEEDVVLGAEDGQPPPQNREADSGAAGYQN